MLLAEYISSVTLIVLSLLAREGVPNINPTSLVIAEAAKCDVIGPVAAAVYTTLVNDQFRLPRLKYTFQWCYGAYVFLFSS